MKEAIIVYIVQLHFTWQWCIVLIYEGRSFKIPKTFRVVHTYCQAASGSSFNFYLKSIEMYSFVKPEFHTEI